MKELFIKVSTVHHSNLVIFIFLQGSCVFQLAFQSRLLGLCFLVLKKIFRLCLLHEDGIVEVCIPGSI